MSDVILDVRNVERHYPSGDSVVKALDGVSLEAHRGELIGITGPSGSGKSTLLLICGLLEPPSRGEAWMDKACVSWPGAQLDTLRDYRRDRIGFVFQKPNLIPFLTAVENVAIALEIARVPTREAQHYAADLLRALDLGHRIDSLPVRLSGGEQQRVAVARALANDPSLILADEPTAALDSVRGRQVMELFKRITRERRACVLVVTHDPRALDLFDRVIELSDGRISNETASRRAGTPL
ncbi:ABC transporter ATP-binding protein [Asticcacaulis sp. AND118]|uniref:ABC transporter ATP-binding protein n=1 Tax=Asticcacaulis sp. AND118 TaxID=2840468 RepID=UPI001CFFF2E7|nr:ABC transporter ATP-binding protein [Asticcacaulis sp. AND118]UDF04988.1 ABC transporter ATP-binding protein [Asticcacaulis sp. AND118]